MKSKGLILFFICLSFLFTACSGDEGIQTSEQLIFKGDVNTAGPVNDIINTLELISKDYGEEKVLAIESTILLEALGKPFLENDLYITAGDGFTVSIDVDTLSETYFIYSETDGWCFVSEKHPVNSRVKHIDTCLLVAKNVPDLSKEMDEEGFNIIVNDENRFITFGQFNLLLDENFVILDGETTFEGTSIQVMKQNKGVSISRLIEEEVKRVMFFTRNGEMVYDYSDGILQFNNQKINYVLEDLSKTYIDVVGLVINPLGNSIMDHYSDASYYLDKGVPVMTLFLDGFSYGEYEAMLVKDASGFMSAIENVKKAYSVYRPVTNAGFAAMITGADPYTNRVHDRSNREMNVDSIFDYCEVNELTHGLVEGDIKILDINTDLTLNLDSNNNGLTDDEIFDSAMEISKENYDYLMIHFHSIDDLGHDFGPTHDEIMNQISIVDGYVEELAKNWPGVIIILADHGMHTTEDGGDHWNFRYEDITVPYMVLRGGAYEEE